MPNIKFKKEALLPIINEGIYDLWLANLKNQWNSRRETSGNDRTIEYLEGVVNASDLIMGSFRWDSSKEGSEFWKELYYKMESFSTLKF